MTAGVDTRHPTPLTFPFKRQIEDFFEEVGRFGLLLYQSFRSIGEVRTYWENLLIQMVRIGVESIPIVALAAAFSGAVTTVQSAHQLISPLIPRSVIGGVVVPSMILELAIVTTALVLAGRVGARIAAEIGTMRVTEQIDALEAMGLNAVAYLVVPRVLAGILMFPVLYAVACFVGIGGGIIAGELSDSIPAREFIEGGRLYFKASDVTFGLIKSLVFGFTITAISCTKGFFASGGAEGVGRATTQAAVQSCVFILLGDYLLATLLL